MSRKSFSHARKPRQQRKKLGIIAKFKHFILLTSAGVFAIAATVTYTTTRPFFDSGPGGALAWSTGAAAGPLADLVPWYVWGGSGLILIYFTYKHKIAMALILGAAAGMWGGMAL
ncbi:MAG: hypothetical protein GY726_11260 [Proteobacteria bacterium]|nr:hypothetical protein [Pseudomonadota bacterium]